MSDSQNLADALRACTGSVQVTVRDGDDVAVSAKPGTPVAPATSDRVLSLMSEARSALLQAIYEGSHVRRQDPAPAHGSPWSEPDVPQAVLFALLDAQEAVTKALATAHALRDPLASA